MIWHKFVTFKINASLLQVNTGSGSFMGCKGSWVRIPPPRPIIFKNFAQFTREMPVLLSYRQLPRSTDIYRPFTDFLTQIRHTFSAAALGVIHVT
jgi:hypothetical protein